MVFDGVYAAYCGVLPAVGNAAARVGAPAAGAGIGSPTVGEGVGAPEVGWGPVCAMASLCSTKSCNTKI